MMRLCCHSLSYHPEFVAGTIDMLGFIYVCRELSLDGVDLYHENFAREDDGYLRQVKMRCLRHGLTIACLSIGNHFGMPEPEQGQMVAMCKRWIDHAQFLGAPQVRVFGGWTPQGETDEVAWDRTVKCLKEVADYGYERGVLVGLQNHNHGSLTKTGDDILRFVEEAGPHLGHVWDTGQYVGCPGSGGSDLERGVTRDIVYDSLEKTVHLATHVRAKTWHLRTGTEEWLNYPRIFQILRKARYNGFVTIMYEGQDPHRQAVERSIAMLRPLMR